MKKNFLLAGSFLMGVLMVFSSCSSDKSNGTDVKKAAGESFTCIEQIIDGCSDIANEVGESKIGEPLNLYNEGKTDEALFAVESWYSFHSREDYSNNILSIRNSYYGTRDGKTAESSLHTLIGKNNATLDTRIVTAINAAYDAILAIPNPFRENINSPKAKTAKEKCADLVDILAELKTYMEGTEAVNQDDVLAPIVNNYVDNVVLPTYKDLKDQNALLYDKVLAFQAAPSNETFLAVANQWLEARAPWETSEAFLFGPVDDKGLDPNMDSWPLDANAIAEILESGNFDELDWSDGDDDAEIEAKQGIRGFHTLEFLTFYNGKARTMNDKVEEGKTGNQHLIYGTSNAASWGNYMKQVALLLKKDASDLYDYWNKEYKNGKSFATMFKEFDF